ncbi:FCD domain-containing protein [Chromohalobacter beijerinckii]|uniref:FCD domain-containing protein n=1 Tax=Chromohalobacter beijerinckii TaxID=86179 RepID=A0ABV8XDY9_9GAMM
MQKPGGHYNTAATHRYLERVAEEHADILEAILAGDSDAARDAMRHHLSRASNTYASYRT